MNSAIVADGQSRLDRCPQREARLRALRQALYERHAAELARAGFFRRLVLRWRIAAELRRDRRKTSPSPQALFNTHPARRPPA